ncbi:Type II secretion system protein [uncultured Desulfatiglans sp.]|uniref:Type II secretion system protein n=1 Tax=Uncultured Desulfatiglans sp. TaxID=1748965 RepID=A0A653A7R8_UNCDX|nr:Type II secretion system protein [uncultured Desulfatiglans sp.]
MKLLAVGILIFLVTVVVLELLLYALRTLRNPYAVKTKKRVKALSTYEQRRETVDIERNRALSSVPLLEKILAFMPGIRKLDRMIVQARASYPPGFFVLLSLLLFMTTFLFGKLLFTHPAARLLTALLAATAPFYYLKFRHKQQMAKFERQLPDALDLIARSLRAGHALTGGMKIVADEFNDPLGPEFDQTLDEINFGPSVTQALKNLAARVDNPDLSLFVTVVILQRETGGNLAEVMENLADIIRQRFKFRGKVRAISAEGKTTAMVLVAIPCLVAVALFFINPDYIDILLTEPLGKLFLGIAVLMMFLGILVIRRMIRIEV